MYPTEQIATAIMLRICIWEVPDLNLDRASAVVFKVLCFYSGPQIKVGIHAAINPKPLPLKSLKIHHSSVSSPEIRRYIYAWCSLLKTRLSYPQIHKQIWSKNDLTFL